MQTTCMAAVFMVLGIMPALAMGETPDARNYPGPAWPPYLAGGLIGVLTWFAMLFSGKPVGASSGYATAAGLLDLKLKATRLGANILGGLIFGFGFACSGYCPGTGAAAVGQGNWDALFMAAGMIAGSFGFAMASAALARTVNQWGNKGKLLLPDLFHVKVAPFVVGFGLLLIGGLWLLERFTIR